MASIASSSRHHRIRPAAATSSRANNNDNDDRPATPEYESLAMPLNATAQRALESLLASKHFRTVKAHIQQATEKLTEIAGEANERATDARHRFNTVSDRRKKKKKATMRKAESRKGRIKVKRDVDGDVEIEDEEEEEQEDHDDDDDEEEDDDDYDDHDDEENEERQEEARKLESLEQKVKTATAQLEERMRGLVDAEYKLDVLKLTVQELAQDAQTAGAASNASRRRNRLRRRDADGDEEMDDAYDDEEEKEDEAPPPLVPSQVLAEKIAAQQNEWESQSLTERYSSNNTYVGFYRIVHDAKHPGNETPPVPHPSTWFNHLERRPPPSRSAPSSNNQERHQEQDDDHDEDEDDDVEIERERISLKCPLTLRTFEDPVKTSKCVHTFERTAIEDMIKASQMTVPAGPDDFHGAGGAAAPGRNARARRVRAAPCPVCSKALTLSDLKPDLVLLRRVRRARAAELREQEEAEFGGGSGHGRRRGLHRRSSGVMIDSDDDDDGNDDSGASENEEGRKAQEQERRIKRERSARVSMADDDESDDSSD